MDLQNKLIHMFNKTVKVNNNIYQIDAKGIARNVADADAKKLLQNKAAWVICVNKASEPAIEKKITKVNEQIAKELIEKEQQIAKDTGKIDRQPAVDPVKDIAEDANRDEVDEEWPDPDLSMPKAYLEEMATAYEVKFNTKTTKKELVDRIMQAMYPDS
jgi:hypothetical protein